MPALAPLAAAPLPAAAPQPRHPGRRLASRVLCSASDGKAHREVKGRRAALSVLAVSAVSTHLPGGEAGAAPSFKKELTSRYKDIPEEEFSDLGGGLKYYVMKQGNGVACKPGDRVAVHFDVKRRDGRLTIATSRQGAGVTGGLPYGFNVGGFGRPGGPFIKGLDLGTDGMVVGELRRLIVPPELAYGNQQVQEIPPGAILKVDVELLSIKKDSPFG